MMRRHPNIGKTKEAGKSLQGSERITPLSLLFRTPIWVALKQFVQDHWKRPQEKIRIELP
jgi:hypothetical protein